MKYNRFIPSSKICSSDAEFIPTKQLLTIMSSSIAYLTSRSNFVQVSLDVPITKQRNPDKFDPPDVFEGSRVLNAEEL